MSNEYLVEINTERPLPTKLLLAPAGRFTGRDGREYLNYNPSVILSTFKNDRRDIPIDIDHELEKSGAGSAIGWISELTEEEGAIYGQVEWSARQWLITNRSYRYISPVFYIGKDRGIFKIESVGLTNKPNLYLKSLNNKNLQEENSMPDNILSIELCNALALGQGATMSEALKRIESLTQSGQPTPPVVAKELCTALRLDAGATVTDALARITSLNSGTNGTHNGVDVVPKADYEVVLNRALTAETQLQTFAADGLKKEVNTIIDAAVAGGQIAPASRGYYMEQCNNAQGLESLKSFLSTAPKVITDSDVVPAGAKGTPTGELNSDEKQFCEQMGVSPEEYALGSE